MDLIFEEEGDDVGSDIEAYCPKCKGDTSHTVITKYEDEIRRVQCSPCGDVHAYRKPRGEVEDDVPEPIAAKKRAALKKATWQEFTAKLGNKVNHLARPYSIRDHYKENDVVTHPKFGIGFVTEISENKVEITFQDERRVLIHNRPDLAAQMPAIAPMPAPRRDDKRRNKAKGKKGAVALPPPPLPAKGKAVAAAKPAAAKPVAAKPLSAKVERAKAAVKKKGAAKGKPARAARPAKRAAPRPAARKPRPAVKKKAAKVKLKVKARKAR